MDLIEIIKWIGWFWLVLAIIYFVIAGYGARRGWRDEEIMGWVKWGIVFVLLWMGTQIIASVSEQKYAVAGMLGWFGAILVVISYWWGFVLLAIVAFAYSVVALGVPLGEGLLAGLLLAMIDFAVENVGGSLGLWRVKKSSFLLGHQPIEVFLVCLFAGGPWFFLAPADLSALIMWVMFTALFGALAEQYLIALGYMEYGRKWDFFKALVTYIVAFASFYTLASLLLA